MSRHARRPRTLFRRIYLHGVALLVLLAAALGAAGLLLGRDVGFRPHPLRLAEHATSLLAVSPESALGAELRALAQELDADVAVFSDDGRRLAAAGESEVLPLSPSDVQRLRDGIRSPRFGHTGAFPVDSGRYLRVSLRKPETEHLRRAVLFLLLVVAVLALASFPFARAMSRPLEQLGRVAERLGQGDLSARARLPPGDEIGELGRAFDEMADRMGRLLEGQRELLANVSHELRTPMARIRVSLDLAAESEPGDARRHLADIERDLAELEALVADLLTTSRLDAGGGLALHRAPIDLRALVEGAVARFGRLHPDRVVHTESNATAVVSGEAGLMDRVVDNLLDNAAKYSEGNAAITVAVGGAAKDVVLLEVRDQGIGMAPEDLDRVFTPFFRTDRSRARDTGGVGLGLALAKRIVEAHGGRIAIESRLGAGTTVRVSLPGVRA